MWRLTRAQVREIDYRSITQYKIPGVVLMENAARAATDVAWQMLGGTNADVLILCGGGNNGGDGLAIVRHLHNRGAIVSIALTADPSKYANEAKANWDIVQAMNLKVAAAEADKIATSQPALIVDAIFGTGLTQTPRDPFAEIVAAVTASARPVLAIDIPSGMDCDTGKSLGACVRATRTITFVAEKAGFTNPAAAEFLGKVAVGDIGCPRELIEELAA